MAELFNYTPTSSVATPSSPTIQVRPNTQLSDTFKSLSGLVSSVQQYKQDEINRETAAFNTQQMIAAEEASQNAAAKATAEEQQALIDNTTKAHARRYMAARKREADLAMLEAGNDVGKAAKIVSDYKADIENFSSSLNPTVYQAIVPKLEEYHNSIFKSATDVQTTAYKDAYTYSVDSAGSTLTTARGDELKSVVSDLQQQGLAAGKNLKEIGKDIANRLGDEIIASLPDTNAIFENTDYDAFNKATDTLNRYLAADPRASEEVNVQLAKIKTLREKLDSYVTGAIADTIVTGDKEQFDKFYSIGLNNKAFTADEGIAYKQKFLDKYTSITTDTKRVASAKFGSNPFIDSNSIADKEIRTKYSALQGEDITAKLYAIKTDPANPYDSTASQKDMGSLQRYSETNPDTYRPIWKDRINTSINSLATLMSRKDTPPEAISAALTDLNTIRRAAFNIGGTADELFQADIVTTLATMTSPERIPEVLKLIRNKGEMPTTFNTAKRTNVAKLKESDAIPDDLKDTALRQFNTLRHIPEFTEEQALEKVMNAYFYDDYGTNLDISNNVATYVSSNAGIASKDMSLFQDVLMYNGDPSSTDALMQDAILSPALRQEVSDIMSGGNAKLNMMGNGIYIRNDTKATYIPLNGERLQAIKAVTMDMVAKRDDPSGVEMMMDSIATSVSKAVGNYTALVGAVWDMGAVNRQENKAILFGGINNLDKQLSMFGLIGTQINETLKGYFGGDMTALEAFNKAAQVTAKEYDKIQNEYLLAQEQLGKDVTQAKMDWYNQLKASNNIPEGEELPYNYNSFVKGLYDDGILQRTDTTTEVPIDKQIENDISSAMLLMDYIVSVANAADAADAPDNQYAQGFGAAGTVPVPAYAQSGNSQLQGSLVSNLKTRNTIELYKNNLLAFEGNYNNASFVHKPSKGSGWTLGVGLDAAHSSAKDFLKAGVPARIVAYMKSRNAFGTTKVAVTDADQKATKLTKEEFDAVMTNVANSFKNTAKELGNKVPAMSSVGLAILGNLLHWGGNFSDNKESKLTRFASNLKGTGRVDLLPANKRGALVSLIQDVVNNPASTDKDLEGALIQIRDSYIADAKASNINVDEVLRIRTINKYIANLQQ